ncbi:M23 family metallopeptidase [Aeromonas jandaei]|uniref:hypothetical protein n=1 Tax=Aeromonas jandaei TaxID=650 RepID=UPI00227AFD1A|nr:hypothetical protein [Aeromonas jandaei]WAG06838.1 M23 family metallopeptidase [Aeromonas jandaei]
MKFAFPILTATGEEFKDVKALTALINGEKSGHYLLGNHNKWHGGIHISDQSAPWCKDKYPVRAIADGKVVAFRMMKDYLTSEFQGESLRYSNCFCLVQHEYCEINAETKAKNEFTFYSLYMHLLPWNKHQRTDTLVLKKVGMLAIPFPTRILMLSSSVPMQSCPVSLCLKIPNWKWIAARHPKRGVSGARSMISSR